jgi:hypothetical protein
MIEVLRVDLGAAEAAGEVLRDTGGSDVVDALVALATRPGDQVLTSDPADIAALLDTRRVRATVVWSDVITLIGAVTSPVDVHDR